jgi:hypothetical protein
MKKTYDIAFSCGSVCAVTQALRAANAQFASFPFDWTGTPSLVRCAKMVADDFAHWIDREDLEFFDIRRGGLNKRVYRNRRTGFAFVHDFTLFKPFDETYPAEAAKYARRIARFQKDLSAAKRVLVVAIEWPILPRLSDDALAEAKRLLEARYPNATFDILYFYCEDGHRDARVVSDADGVTVVACDYRTYIEGKLDHVVDNAELIRYLNENVSVADPRTDAEKARYADDWKRQDAKRWKGRNWLETMVNRSAFRLYRKLEWFLIHKGLVPMEQPMFGLAPATMEDRL